MAKKSSTFYVDVRYTTTFTVPVAATTKEEAIRIAKAECDADEETQGLDFLDATIHN